MAIVESTDIALYAKLLLCGMFICVIICVCVYCIIYTITQNLNLKNPCEQCHIQRLHIGHGFLNQWRVTHAMYFNKGYEGL